MMSNKNSKEMMSKGCVIKIKTRELFDDVTERRNKAPWVYGMIDFLEDVCEVTKERAWNINWACEYLCISMEIWSHLCAVMESDLTLVRRPCEDNCVLDKYYSTASFFEREEDGKWKVNVYKASYEYCGSTDCDRMEF